VVGGLFGEVRDLDLLAVARSAHAAAGRCRGGVVFERRRSVIDFPVTLRISVHVLFQVGDRPTLKNSPSVELYGLHGLPLTYFYAQVNTLPDISAMHHTKSFVNQNRSVPSMRPRASSESPILHFISH
jgi:hypothetical protein